MIIDFPFYQLSLKLLYEIHRNMILNKKNKPTASELEILQVLWSKDSATVREVHEELLKIKGAGYTTTLKLMQIMFEKGLVTRDSTNKTHLYQSAVSRENTQTLFLNGMIDSLFSGSSAQLVMQALGNHKASKEELEEIKDYLNNIK